jgi:hypothetical protein
VFASAERARESFPHRSAYGAVVRPRDDGASSGGVRPAATAAMCERSRQQLSGRVSEFETSNQTAFSLPDADPMGGQSGFARRICTCTNRTRRVRAAASTSSCVNREKRRRWRHNRHAATWRVATQGSAHATFPYNPGARSRLAAAAARLQISHLGASELRLERHWFSWCCGCRRARGTRR